MNQSGSNSYTDYSAYSQGYQPYYYGFAGQNTHYGTQQRTYPQPPTGTPLAVPIPASPPVTGPQIPGMLPLEQSFIENILRLNKGKLVTVYATFENNREWNAKIFKGIIEAAGRDHLILSDPQTGLRYLIPMIYVDYITFEEEIEYEYPFGAAPGMSGFSPR